MHSNRMQSLSAGFADRLFMEAVFFSAAVICSVLLRASERSERSEFFRI